MVVFIGYLLGS